MTSGSPADGAPLAAGAAPAARGIRIVGTGSCLPRKAVSNDELARTVETNDAWITKRTGIKQRYIVSDDESLRSLAVGAVKQALEQADMPAGDLDMVICATMTPEMNCPSTAARIAAELDASPAGAMDLSAACAGFVYGINVAHGLLLTGHYKNIAVIGAEVMSRVMNWDDRTTCVLFGDGAGAAILSASDDPSQGCLYQNMGSNGHLWHELYVPRHERDVPKDCPAFNGALNTLQMNGREVFKFAVTTLEDCIDQAMKATGLSPDQLKVVIPHQSNSRILESARIRLDLPKEAMMVNIQHYANTSAASVPICLNELNQAGRLEKGDRVLFVGLGGGLTWASSVWQL